MEMTFDTALKVVFAASILASVWYSLRKAERKNNEINRAVEEKIRRRAEAEERWRAYEENYRREGNALKKCVLDDLKAIGRGEKLRLDPESLDAVIALQARQGDHPETVEAWTPVIEDLKGEISDAKAMQYRLDDLLYPEALEDVDALKQRVCSALENAAGGERLDAEVFEAAKALNEITARDARKKREEWESEARELRRQKEKDQKFRAAMNEMARDSARNIARMYGLPASAFDNQSLQETLVRIRTLRELNELARKPLEEREQILRELEK